MDLVYCALTVAFAAATVGFVALCARVDGKP